MKKYFNTTSGLCGVFLSVALLSATADSSYAADGSTIFSDNCASCHDVVGPGSSTLEALKAKKAPDLFYAGSKFKPDWLVEWIQNTTQIRPSGMMFLNNIEIEDGKDKIESEEVESCPSRLDGDQAADVAAYLMALTDPTMKLGVVNPDDKFRKGKAETLISKQTDCVGCHTVNVKNRDIGGVSGPDLREAGKRLNIDWIYALIEDPKRWTPKTWMPHDSLSEEKRILLTAYIASMGK
jgi:mono/diheme cytochrome c family protein|tara:strand:+ start:897 stop:1610 length:714 start_codon:yes stop_codon:yes gene_type:complete